MRMRVHAERMCVEVCLAAHPTMFVCCCFSGKFEISPLPGVWQTVVGLDPHSLLPPFPLLPSPLSPLARHSTFLSLFGQCRRTIE